MMKSIHVNIQLKLEELRPEHTQLIITLHAKHCFHTNMKSSSAPLKRNIIGLGGFQSESTITLASSIMDAAEHNTEID